MDQGSYNYFRHGFVHGKNIYSCGAHVFYISLTQILRKLVGLP